MTMHSCALKFVNDQPGLPSVLPLGGMESDIVFCVGDSKVPVNKYLN